MDEEIDFIDQPDFDPDAQLRDRTLAELGIFDPAQDLFDEFGINVLDK